MTLNYRITRLLVSLKHYKRMHFASPETIRSHHIASHCTTLHHITSHCTELFIFASWMLSNCTCWCVCVQMCIFPSANNSTAWETLSLTRMRSCFHKTEKVERLFAPININTIHIPYFFYGVLCTYALQMWFNFGCLSIECGCALPPPKIRLLSVSRAIAQYQCNWFICKSNRETCASAFLCELPVLKPLKPFKRELYHNWYDVNTFNETKEYSFFHSNVDAIWTREKKNNQMRIVKWIQCNKKMNASNEWKKKEKRVWNANIYSFLPFVYHSFRVLASIKLCTKGVKLRERERKREKIQIET